MATEQTVFTYDFYVPATTNLFIIAGGKNGYTNYSPNRSYPWFMNVYMDGALIGATGGAGAATDTPSLFTAATGVAGGTHHTIKLTWGGDPAIQFTRAAMLMLSSAK